MYEVRLSYTITSSIIYDAGTKYAAATLSAMVQEIPRMVPTGTELRIWEAKLRNAYIAGYADAVEDAHKHLLYVGNLEAL